ncbi:putative peptidoglycan lipid II flippase [Thermocatellispora tengchongensis]|uniref:Putative peptidoglycan lipid II flippase n=2 Tax=Thermocatellispora tengchongensis TaxID=1073253 RepID=A0A840PFS2_9ACTN|nr:lipid II flippase MurJ [Thermocatellispora tengchongensis]MBB5135997.1 putative peptidoglycan lipid II flippase [Thermocatellispora tengchongensis]
MTKRLGQGLAGAAVLIAVITVAARVTGFGKQLAFARTVGTNCLSTAYFTANQIPNLVFEIVVGGALAGMVVPVLAGAAARSAAEDAAAAEREEARRQVGWITSALLTWVVIVLVPLAVLTALAAGPVIALFVGPELRGCNTGDVLAVATRMLVVFAPQIPLYGLAVVLYGVLQAHRRFAAPALAPLVSSLVVIVAYLAFVPLSGGVTDPGTVPGAAELALSVGTTLGVLALVVTVLGPAGGLRLRLRPALRFPPGVAAQVRRLAVAGLAALLAQQAATALVVVLANRAVGEGAIAAYNYAWAIYQVPYAVLAVPIATSAFPVLSQRAAEDEAFAEVSARTSRAVILVSGLAAGLLAAVAVPVAAVFVEGAASAVPATELGAAIALFAPGLVGYGLIAHLSRVLYAAGRGRAAAAGTVAGWVAVMAAQTALVLTLPADWRIGGLGLGSALGMTVGGAVLALAVARARGAAALRGAWRATAAAVLGGGLAWAAGAGVVAAAGAWTGPEGVWQALAVACLAAVAALAAGGAGIVLVARRDAEALLARLPLPRARRGRERVDG